MCSGKQRTYFTMNLWKTLALWTIIFALFPSTSGASRPVTIHPHIALTDGLTDYVISDAPSSCTCRIMCMLNYSCTAVSVQTNAGGITCSFANAAINPGGLTSDSSAYTYIQNAITQGNTSIPTDTTLSANETGMGTSTSTNGTALSTNETGMGISTSTNGTALSTNETGMGTSTSTNGTALSTNETGMGSSTSTNGTTLSTNETGMGTSTSTNGTTLSTNETGMGSPSSTNGTALSTNETGMGSSTSTNGTTLPTNETGMGTSASTNGTALSINETGMATSTSTNGTTLSTNETGMGTSASTNGTALPCGTGWKVYNNSCYYFANSSVQKAWDDASNICNRHGSYLAKITSAEESNFIKNDNDCTKCWIGLRRYFPYERFKWNIDGSLPTYTEWASGEPGYYYCTYIDDDKMWHDDIGLTLMRFVCEKAVPPS